MVNTKGTEYILKKKELRVGIVPVLVNLVPVHVLVRTGTYGTGFRWY